MKKNGLLVAVTLVLILVLGLGGSYWAYKKIQTKRHQEYRYEGKLKVGPGFEEDVFKALILADESLESVIDKFDLLQVWGLADTPAAKARIRSKFSLKLEAGELKISYQDKNKELAPKILQELMALYQAKIKKLRSESSGVSS